MKKIFQFFRLRRTSHRLVIFILIIIVSLVVVTIVLQEQKELSLFFVNEARQGKRIEDLSEINWQWVYSQKKLYQLTPTEIDLILRELQQRFPDKGERLKALSVLRLGTPYQLGCLGEEFGRDKDPVFRLDVADCTVFVLTNTALLYSQTIKEAEEMMKFLNYRPEENLEIREMKYEIAFEDRLHFTVDRNAISPYFQDVTEQVAGPGRVKEKKIILNKIKTNSRRLIDIGWEKEVKIKYIPNEYITKEFLAKLPQAVGVAFIKEGDEEIGLDVRHEGFLFSGELFFHASSVEKKIVVRDFFEYYFRNGGSSRFDGIIVFEVK